MKILFATGNQHKKEELASMIKDYKIVTPKDLNIEFNCEETGKTFFENAMIKAEFLFSKTGNPVLADDSGLCIDALNGAPGIYSARFGKKEIGKELSNNQKMDLVLKKMKDEKNRSARFVCCMVLILSKDRIYSIQETIEGEINYEKYGKGGFGYDPIFYLPNKGCTMAELSKEEKNLISHRGKATRLISKIIKKIFETS